MAWALTLNLATPDPHLAWREMLDTCNAQAELKAASGRDSRGRKNTKPVLHFTLSWAEGENPSAEHMKATAISAMKAIGLAEHEALVVAHNDTAYPHVHLVVNSIHPQTGLTAELKFTKEKLSRWAEAYEREHGIHCEQRIENNAQREEATKARQLDPSVMLMAAGDPERERKVPYVPVKHKPLSRQQWFARKEIIDRMKAMRAEIDAQIKLEKNATWQHQLAERDALDAQTEAAIDEAMQNVKAHYKPYWRQMYQAHRRERRYVKQVVAYEALQALNKPLSAKEAMDAVLNPKNPVADLAREHEQARRALGLQQRADAKLYSNAIMEWHREQFEDLKRRQAQERQQQSAELFPRTREVSFEAAKASLQAERDAASAEDRKLKRAKEADQENAPTLEQRLNRPSEQAQAREEPDRAKTTDTAKALPRSEQIKQAMEEWRKRNNGKDMGREL